MAQDLWQMGALAQRPERAAMIEIALNVEQFRDGARVGCERFIDGQMNRRRPAHGASDGKNEIHGWYWSINGACGEKVVSVWSGVPWDGNFGDFGAADVGRMEVRTTRGHDFALCLHKTDKPASPYILVTGTGPTWRIQGWIMGQDGMQEKYWRDLPGVQGRTAYWVPQEDLHTNLEEFKERWLAGLK